MSTIRTVGIALLLGAICPCQSQVPESALTALSWREVGPPRGGRVAAVCGIPNDRNTYWFGACGGGVWKTSDAGRSWQNMSDGTFGGSVGAVAVSEWDPNVVYVGGGEKTVRGNVSHGDGVWKSTDAGRSWAHMGLSDSRHISRIRIHPREPEWVYAAVMGHLFGPSEERGIYRSWDGGATWDRVHFVNPNAGCVDLVMDPTNPRILYAAFWRISRTPYSLESGGEGSTLWKSTDSGETWEDITENTGLPKGVRGIAGLAVSPTNPDNVYAIIESEEGGVFRSRDGGKTWARTNSDRSLRQRAWYYSRIYADPKSEDVVYVLNVSFHRSQDGGRTFQTVGTPHSDNHDLWIDPSDPLRMIESNDGGANISEDGGKTWSSQENQPTAQMYRVSLDSDFPYRLLGGQQDNTALRIRSRSAQGRRIGDRDWEPTAGGESGHVVAHPKIPDLVVGGSYGGYLSLLNHRTGEHRTISPWPDNPLGAGVGEQKHRFQWNFPILFSRHDPNVLYAGSQMLLKSENMGHSFSAISGDLTTNDPAKMGSSGGPITQDNTGVEYYCTLFAIAESASDPNVIWCGSDDGLIHRTDDGGTTWTNVTPPWPEGMLVNALDAHPFEARGLYVAGTRYKSDDFEPYLYRTVDGGVTWVRIDGDLPRGAFTRVVRADPVRPGLLYAGTERGVHVSFDDGAQWLSLQRDLPIVPVTDLALRDADLVVATQGRGYWILDDISPLRVLSSEVASSSFHVFLPEPGMRLVAGQGGGVTFTWILDEEHAASDLNLEIRFRGETIRRLRKKTKDGGSPGDADRDEGPGAGTPAPAVLPAEPGSNRWTWDLRYEGAERFPGMVLWNGRMAGPRAIPGRYEAVFRLGKDADLVEITVPFEVRQDPRSSGTEADLEAQLAFSLAVRDQLTETHREISNVRNVRRQIESVGKSLKGFPAAEPVLEAGKTLVTTITGIEETLYQTKSRSNQDPLNFPIRLNDKLAGLLGVADSGDAPPTVQATGVLDVLGSQINEQLAALRQVWEVDLPAFNKRVQELGAPAIQLKEKKPDS